jgi:predicted permease
MRQEWFRRIRHFLLHRSFEDELDEEIRFHLHARVEELVQSGLSPADALAQARREFGSDARAREESRAPWRFLWLEDFAADLRYAARVCAKSPAFTTTAVLSLALGIGGVSTIYTALDVILMRPLPVAHPEDLVGLTIVRASRNPIDIPAPFAAQLRDAHVFSDLFITNSDGLSFSYGDRAERIIGEAVSSNYFDLLGVPALLGQCFTPEVHSGHWAPEVVLSYHFWQRRFGGDPAIIGNTIRLNSAAFTIVGVTPASFFGMNRATDYELRLPMLPPGQEMREISLISGAPRQWRGAVARLQPGVTIAQAKAAADAQLSQFLRTTPIGEFRRAQLLGMRIEPAGRGFDNQVAPLRNPLYLLAALVVAVLLIACMNLAGMLLARGAARAREFAIRTSIGAGRFRLIRQLLAESLLLSVGGAVLGFAFAYLAASSLFHFLPQGHTTLVADLHPGSRTLVFTSGVAILTSILFGLAPALRTSRTQLAGALKAPNTGGLRKLLVASQVAFSLALLIAAGSFVRTLSLLRPSDYQGSADRVLLFTMKPQRELYTDDRKRQLVEELTRRISGIAGVQSTAMAEYGPLGSRADSDDVQAPSGAVIHAGSDQVTPGFFNAAGLRRVDGRDFTRMDVKGAPFTVIVNQSLARLLFPNGNPIGQSVHVPSARPKELYQIVGVVADARYYNLHKAPGPFIWFPLAQVAPYMPTLLVRTNRADTAGMISEIRREFDAVDKDFPVFNIRTMALRIDDAMAGERLQANLSEAFGAVALMLAGVGLYGVLAYSVSRRSREIGIRIALGARSPAVLWMIAREALALTGSGCLLGLAFAAASSRVFSHYLDGVASPGPVTIAACVAGMFLLAVIAIAGPSLRGCKIDPAIALRQD